MKEYLPFNPHACALKVVPISKDPRLATGEGNRGDVPSPIKSAFVVGEELKIGAMLCIPFSTRESIKVESEDNWLPELADDPMIPLRPPNVAGEL